MSLIKSLPRAIKETLNTAYHSTSIAGVCLIFVVILLSLVVVFNDRVAPPGAYLVEGYQDNSKYLYKRGPTDIYDNFYSDVYDFLVYSDTKDEYEIGAIVNRTNPTTQSKILDVGSGTGHHVGLLGNLGLKAVGIDISPSMVKKAQANYPQGKFMVGDAANNGLFPYGSFTHILCMYFTIYYMRDKATFFRNCYDWLMPGGFLILHLVDKERFDPVLPAGNPLFIVSPQKYAKDRLTRSKVTFDQFKYESDFMPADSTGGKTVFKEKFVFNDGRVRQHDHEFFMEPHQDILVIAKDQGFLVSGQIDMTKCSYDNQYLYILTKPAH